MTESQFLVALGQIIVIDILLSGDNAIVIALAARSLPKHQQRWAILGGAAGAVGLRIVFATVIIYLMAIPYLKLVGGVLLLWIAIKLLLPDDDGKDGVEAKPGNTKLLGAMGTIIMADAVMSLDNVIGIAAAAKGSILLLSIGLAISIPICIFGATLVLRLLGRFPWLVTGGCALLGWIAGDIAYADPGIAHLTEGLHPYWHHAVAGATMMLVVIVGHAIARHLARRRKVLDIAE
ncbi:MAG: TerC family protein [Rhodospirillales bacterium]